MNKEEKMHLFIRILVVIGSLSSIAFGVWHFFVPKMWKWYSYIQADATELVMAVRAVNVFFSLSLVLFGVLNLLLVFSRQSSQFTMMVILGVSSMLWVTRVAMQVIYPQGTQIAGVQYGMLAAFVLISLCFLIPLATLILAKTP